MVPLLIFLYLLCFLSRIKKVTSVQRSSYFNGKTGPRFPHNAKCVHMMCNNINVRQDGLEAENTGRLLKFALYNAPLLGSKRTQYDWLMFNFIVMGTFKIFFPLTFLFK